MAQPPPAGPQFGGPPQGVDVVVDEPAENVDKSLSVVSLSHSGHVIASAGAEMDCRRAKTWPQSVHRYS